MIVLAVEVGDIVKFYDVLAQIINKSRFETIEGNHGLTMETDENKVQEQFKANYSEFYEDLNQIFHNIEKEANEIEKAFTVKTCNYVKIKSTLMKQGEILEGFIKFLLQLKSVKKLVKLWN